MKKKLSLRPGGILRYCILIAFTLWVWNFFRSYLLFLALILMICCPIVSFLLLWFSRDMLQVQAVLPSNKVGKGKEFFFDIRVYNPRRLAAFSADISYCWSNLFTGYSEQKKQRVWIAPGGNNEIKQRLSSRFAGGVETRIESFKVYDLFQMFCLHILDKSDADVMVWPAFSDAEGGEIHDYVEGFPKENETKKRGTDYNPDYEIREYIPGDELKTIHWKLSAKQEQLMVRERLATGREKINVLLPLSDNKQINDSLMEAVYTLCGLLIQKEYPIQLYWPGNGNDLLGRFVAELGELENVLEEILSDNGLHMPGTAEAQMSVKCPGESYILIQTGAYKGAYIR